MSGRWDSTLRFAMRAWGMAPRDVWRLSLREWRALSAGDVAPLGRDEMAGLMRAWPDAPVPSLHGEGGEAKPSLVGKSRGAGVPHPPRCARHPPHEGEGGEDRDG